MKRKLDPNEPNDPAIERELGFLTEIVRPYLRDTATLRRNISLRMLGIKNYPKEDAEVALMADLKVGGAIVPKKSGAIQGKNASKRASFSKLRYGLYTVPAGLLGGLATKFFLNYGLKKEYSVGVGVLTSFAYYLAFINDNPWIKAVFSSMPVMLAALFYHFKDNIIRV